MSSILTVDAIAEPIRVPELDGKYCQVRLVHLSDSDPGGHRHLLVDAEAAEWTATGAKADPAKIAHGRTYEMNLRELKDITRKVRLGGRSLNIPVLFPSDVPTRSRRLPEVEDEIRSEISILLKAAPEAALEPGAVADGGAGRPGRKSRIAVCDVGQGDTIGIRFADGGLWLVDAYFWTDAAVGDFPAWLKAWSGRSDLDCLVLSHLHYDHIRSAQQVINEMHPKQVIVTADFVHPTGTARNLLRYCAELGVLRVVRRSAAAMLGGVETTVMAAPELMGAVPPGDNPNDHGLFVWLKGREAVAVLPGDAPGGQLEMVVSKHLSDCARFPKRIYKVSHHCSATGFNRAFLDQLSPTHAATSCGAGNRYKFPEPSTRDAITALAGEFSSTSGHGITCKHGSLQYELE